MSETATHAAPSDARPAPSRTGPDSPDEGIGRSGGRRTFTGSCHCGAVQYEAEAEITSVVACNCSICSKKGTLLAFTSAADFRLVEGEGRLAEYRFNKHVIRHLFCTTCGVEPFARGIRPDGVEMVALNVRCLDDIDVDALPVQPYDGRSA